MNNVVQGSWAEKGKVYWAFINDEPRQIRFIYTLPYHGFCYINLDDELVPIMDGKFIVGYKNTIDCNSEATFADTKEDLIQFYIERLNRRIKELNLEIEKFQKM